MGLKYSTIQKIALQQIDLRDETFSVNFMPDLQSLRSSIAQMGLIQPVILREDEHRYQIVCGFRRASILRELGYHDIEARVIGEKEKDRFELFSFSLHEN